MLLDCRKSSCPPSVCGFFFHIHTTQSGCQWLSAKTLGTMSRCYPYPPPGYEKKAYVEPPLSPKKEKHKHKDKKRKRRKDKEISDDLGLHDKGKRSKKDHQSGHIDDVPNSVNRIYSEHKSNLANGVYFEDMLNVVNGNLPQRQATRPEGVHKNATQILQANRIGERTLADTSLAPIRNELELNSVVDQASSTSCRAATSGIGAAITSTGVSEIEDELNRKRRVEFMPHVEKVWSAVDDQEWLFLRDTQLQIGPKETRNAERAQVLADAIFLPSVGIYALPYIVLD